MAFASSSIVPAVSSLATFLPMSEKLTHSNHVLWKSQVLSVLKGAWLDEFIDSMAKPPEAFLEPKEDDKKEAPTPNLEYAMWVAKDQTIVNYLMSNLLREILAQVSMEVTVATAWAANEGMLAS
jgi:hypothetical protein